MTTQPMHRQSRVEPATITKEEMDKVIRRSFRALDPELGTFSGELFYDLTLEPDSNVVIRVMTSINSSRGVSYNAGEDAIRVGLAIRGGKPLKKFAIVKRIQTVDDKTGKVTTTWPDNLRARIQDEMEDYHNREDYWKQRAAALAPSAPPSTGRAVSVEDKLKALIYAGVSVDAFKSMLRNVQRGYNLSEKQLAWVNGAYARLRR